MRVRLQHVDVRVSFNDRECGIVGEIEQAAAGPYRKRGREQRNQGRNKKMSHRIVCRPVMDPPTWRSDGKNSIGQ